jgi:hypothetical protein
MSLRAEFLRLDDELARHGVPPLTDWWREGLGEWLDTYEAGGALELIANVGRGAAKSTALYKLGVFFTLFGDFAVPPGERHYAVVLSRLKEEAGKGIAIVGAWLRLLRVPHRVAGDVIDLDGVPRGIRVVAASVAATSGWRAFFVASDERSKWPSGGELGQDADEIDTSAVAMTATHARAPIVSAGSAWGAYGGWHAAVMGGTTADRHVLGPAPTWVAAPHITEESTRRKERDPKRWAREYACQWSAGATSALDVEALRGCVRELHPAADYLHGPELVIDSSGGRHDAFIAAVFAWMLEPGYDPDVSIHRGPLPPSRPVLWLADLAAWEGDVARRMSTHDVADGIARLAREWGAHRVHGDQFGSWSWASDLAKRRLRFEDHPWTAPAKVDAILRLRQLIRDTELVINPELGTEADLLLGEAATFEERILPSGALSFAGRGRTHDDRIMTLMLAARCDTEGHLRGSPLGVSRERVEIYGSDAENEAAFIDRIESGTE